ncbi:hypothetical protein F5544_28320 [Nocardia arthritidis]|uniref:Excalibur calcium-binding domain-containing protein n=1 Tax=Nocardia arthritidis TaxID=228602 RepID=A0A6G9YUM7_9NOCA|nr:hypothetical protein F5544_28320 [Nocardia arthritidis]
MRGRADRGEPRSTVPRRYRGHPLSGADLGRDRGDLGALIFDPGYRAGLDRDGDGIACETK